MQRIKLLLITINKIKKKLNGTLKSWFDRDLILKKVYTFLYISVILFYFYLQPSQDPRKTVLSELLFLSLTQHYIL